MTVIAFVGSFGSGCTAISDILIADHKYKRISLDTFVRGDFIQTRGKKPVTRTELYDFADAQRMRFGTDYYAKMALDPIKGGGGNLIINDIKHADEVLYGKRKFPKIIVFGIRAEKNERWERRKDEYKGDKSVFEKDDQREQGINDVSPYRQSMNKCFGKVNVIMTSPGGTIAMGNQHTEDLIEVLIEKIAWYSKHPPSEAVPEIVDVTAERAKKENRFGLHGQMTLTMSAAAACGGGVLGAIGHAIAARNAVPLTIFTHICIGAVVGAILCLAGLIAYGQRLKYQNLDLTEEETDK
jgi:dephospho-CoA kinase